MIAERAVRVAFQMLEVRSHTVAASSMVTNALSALGAMSVAFIRFESLGDRNSFPSPECQDVGLGYLRLMRRFRGMHDPKL